MQRRPRPARCRALAAFAVPAALVALTGCGSSTTVTTTVTSAASTQTSATSTQTSASSSATSTESSTTTVAGPPLCTAATLSLRILGQQGATGHGEIGVAMQNTGSNTCHTFGYPGVLFLDKAGRALPTDSDAHDARLLRNCA